MMFHGLQIRASDSYILLPCINFCNSFYKLQYLKKSNLFCNEVLPHKFELRHTSRSIYLDLLFDSRIDIWKNAWLWTLAQSAHKRDAHTKRSRRLLFNHVWKRSAKQRQSANHHQVFDSRKCPSVRNLLSTPCPVSRRMSFKGPSFQLGQRIQRQTLSRGERASFPEKKNFRNSREY